MPESPYSLALLPGTPEWGCITGQREHRCPYITVWWVISWFIKIDLKQIYCSYSRTHKIQNDFLQFLVLVLRSTLLLNMWMRKNDHYGKSFTLESRKQGWTHVRQNHGRPQGVQNGHFPPLEIGTKNQNLLENVTSAAPFRLIDLFLTMTVYQPVRNSRCTRTRFTVLVSCSAELAVY